MPTAVVTGGAGFLGSHLCEHLLAKGMTVWCVDNLCTGRIANIEHLGQNERFHFSKQNVSEHILIPGEVDYVLHFASPASPSDYLNMPIQTLKVGALGTHNALGLAKAKRSRFILASTSEVYGDPLVHPQTEAYWGNVNPVGPRAVYDEAKRFAEALTMAYRRIHRLSTGIVRIFNTYGPRMRIGDGRALPTFMKQALLGEDITVYGDGRQTRSFCYVDDLIDGIIRLLFADEGDPINLGNPEEITLQELAEEIVKLTGSCSRIVYRSLPQDDPKRRRPDITRARAVLGWEPRISRAEGLRQTLAYFRRELGLTDKGAAHEKGYPCL